MAHVGIASQNMMNASRFQRALHTKNDEQSLLENLYTVQRERL